MRARLWLAPGSSSRIAAVRTEPHRVRRAQRAVSRHFASDTSLRKSDFVFQGAHTMPFSLPDLPYSNDALVPFISVDTLTVHHGKHHAGYVANLNRLVEGTELAGKSLEEVVRVTAGRSDRSAIHQNAAQAWNHEFYWHSLAHGGGGKPRGAIAARIAADFGGHERFAAQFAEAASSQFGSGWAWLCLRDG